MSLLVVIPKSLTPKMAEKNSLESKKIVEERTKVESADYSRKNNRT